MDVLEVLVLLIALVLIALVVSVVLVIVQALTSRKKKSVAAVPAADISPAVVVEKAPVEAPVVNVADSSAKPAQEPAKAPQPEVREEQPTVKTETIQKPSHSPDEDKLRRPAVEMEDTGIESSSERYPYMAGGPLLSPIERLFYGDLKASVSDRTEIFCKVRASDVINPKASLSFEEMQFASEQLATQRFDFVLCDAKDFAVLCVIELDGLGEREGLRKIQREILRKSAESANLPILLVDMKRGYTIKEIRDRVNYLMPKDSESFISDGRVDSSSSRDELLLDDDDILFTEVIDDVAPEVVVEEAFSAVGDRAGKAASNQEKVSPSRPEPLFTPNDDALHRTLCPRCQSPLKLSLATTGEFAGRYFWICTKLPECPYVAPVNPPE